MFYEAQVAGLPDTSPAVRLVKKASVADLATRRGEVLTAVSDVVGHDLELVNSGGTGSLETSASDPVVTEVTSGSGLYVPGLFDGYRSFDPHPSAFFGLDVVRVPAPGYATAFAGGYVASGPAGAMRVPRVVEPGWRLTSSEGVGEVRRRCAPPAGPSDVSPWATASGSGTPRQASSWSASTACTSCAATRSSRRSPPTGAREELRLAAPSGTPRVQVLRSPALRE